MEDKSVPGPQELASPKIERKTGKLAIVSKTVGKLVNYLKEPRSQEDPDQTLAYITNGTVPEFTSGQSEDTKQLDRANKLLESFRSLFKMTSSLRSNEVIGGATVMAVAVLAEMAGLPDSFMSVATVITTLKDKDTSMVNKVRRAAVNVGSIVGAPGLDEIPVEGADQLLNTSSGFLEIGKQAVAESTAGRLSRAAINIARNRMTPRPSSVVS